MDVTIRSSETVQDSYLTLGHIKWFYGTTCVVNQNAIVLKDQSKSVSTQQECSCETRGDTSLQLKVLPASHCPLKHLDPTLGAELPSCKALCVLIARVFHLHQPHQSLDCRFECPISHKGHTTSCGMDEVVSKSLRWQSWFTHSQSDRNTKWTQLPWNRSFSLDPRCYTFQFTKIYPKAHVVWAESL